ncbi:hypothetical protein T484DRAFT_1974793 [Baffinella frigidus]|nr:hypothetical protein T484DRAFT_1974793 [Cryptophyta sp. CCMP2293]
MRVISPPLLSVNVCLMMPCTCGAKLRSASIAPSMLRRPGVSAETAAYNATTASGPIVCSRTRRKSWNTKALVISGSSSAAASARHGCPEGQLQGFTSRQKRQIEPPISYGKSARAGSSLGHSLPLRHRQEAKNLVFPCSYFQKAVSRLSAL